MMSGAELAALRAVMGHSLDSLAAALQVNPRTVRSWESGRDRISDRAEGLIWGELARHDEAVERMLDAEMPIALSRGPVGDRPRGWWAAAAGRAMLADPDIEVEWAYAALHNHG
ncbi:helix-turn-helix domain-containing protein [Segatella copri]|uniref:helix-turn-helix domain-containing protein n=2 Tax=cellular organisms TaxID=131567 RepID=UPI003F8A8DBB